MRVLVVVLAVLAACAARDVAPSSSHVAPAASAPGVVAPGLRLPEGVTPLDYRVRLEIDPAQDTFAGHVEIRTQLAAPTRVIWLHARELAIKSATLRTHGRVRPLRVVPEQGDEMIGVAADVELDAGEVTVVFDYTGRIRSDQVGLFRQRVDEQWFVYSQGQAVFTRLFVPSFDEPRFKTPWQITLVVPAGQVALSNAPVASERTLDDGRREVTFAELGPLPSYIVALAVGPFALVDDGVVGRGKVPFRAAVFPSDATRTKSLRTRVDKILTQLELYLDQPLPWPKLDFVAVPEFFGAMENVGLVTFEAAVMFDEGEGEYTFARVAAHELAHQWFGNSLTPAWWDELWLSEAFASFLGDAMASAAGEPGDLALARQLARSEALIADAAATPVALRRPIMSNVSVDDGFDAVAYQKGAAVLVMVESFLDPAKFRELVRGFVRAHATGSITTTKLIAAVRAVDPQVADSLASIATHAGTPVIELELVCDGKPRLIASARDGATVPVCVRVEGSAQRTCAVVHERVELPLVTPRCPAWVVGNADGTGYYEVAPAAPRSLPLAPISALRAPERMALGADVASSFARGALTASAAFVTARALLATPDPYAKLGGLAILRAIDPIVTDEDRATWETWLRKRMASVVPKKATRPVDHAVLETAAELLVQRIPSRRMFDAIVAQARGVSDRMQADLLAGLGAAAGELAPALVDLVLDARLPTSHTTPPLLQMLGRSDARTATWTAIRARLPELLARISRTEARSLLLATSALCVPAARSEVTAAFTPRLSSIPDGDATLAASLAAVDRCLGVRAAAGEILKALPR